MRPTSRCGRWSSSAATCGPTTSPSGSPTPASAIPTSTPRATTGSARVYPVIPGHEIVGTVTAIGDEVTRHRVGDTVAVGCMVDSCMDVRPVPRRLGSVLPQGLRPDLQQPRLSRRHDQQGRLHRPYRRPRPFRPEGPRRHGRQPRRAIAVRRHHHLLAAAPVSTSARAPRWRWSGSAASATWASSSARRWARTSR